MPDINLEQSDRAETIAAAWYQALLDSGDMNPATRVAQPELLDITRQIIALSSTDQFQTEAARAIGECLARLGYKHVDIIGKVPTILSQMLTQGLDPIQVNTINTRLANVLTQVITGFLDQHYQATIAEKEHSLEAYEAEWKRIRADSQEIERQRIARELHDSVLNELGAMMIAPAEALTPKTVRDKNEKMYISLHALGLALKCMCFGSYRTIIIMVTSQ